MITWIFILCHRILLRNIFCAHVCTFSRGRKIFCGDHLRRIFQRPILNIFVLDIEKVRSFFSACYFLLYFDFVSDIALNIPVIAGVDITHDFLQKGQIHVVSIEYAKLSVFQTWIESFYCNWFPIHIFYFIHSFSFILWYCFEHFCHRWSGHDWKICQSFQASSADTRFSAKMSNPWRDCWIRKT